MQSQPERAPEPVVTLLLVRHGLTEQTGSRLAGRAPGLHLDDRGTAQAKEAARRLSGLDLSAVVSSPLERCRETAETLAEAVGRDVLVDDRFVECDYGEWTGRELKDLPQDPLWRIVQSHPAAARFPGGESLAEVSHRAVAAVRDWNTRLTRDRTSPVYLVCSHGDVIQAVIADALGMHLDQFQRLQVDPCSLTVLRYTPTRPFAVRLNDVGDANVAAAVTPTPAEAAGDAPVGGGAGAHVQTGESSQ